jgi:2-polyprenyl-6-methoxyphenol hydroxylase-like FAD-dependent oxidoreductase
MSIQVEVDLAPAPRPVQKTLFDTGCCIAGGGPAGMMLGFLLARAGVAVIVLEKHADFFRDFRGDTIHPSTLELMYELGLLDEFLRRPHQEFASLSAQIDQFEVPVADFSHLPTRCKFIALMPQWDFLNFIAENGKRYPNFHLMMQAEVTRLLEHNGRVIGVRATTPQGEIEVRARLTVGADGRHSIVRKQARFTVIDRGAPIDVLWMRLRRKPDDPTRVLGRFAGGRILITLDRGDYWQCAFVIPKGGFAEVRRNGLPAFCENLATVAPFLRDRVDELASWEDIKLLTVAVDRLQTWSLPGLLCIGDAAHVMSPIGGVGINLAIQDAVAAANLLARPLLRGNLTESDVRAVQRRREFPTRVTQGFQVFVHHRFLGPAMNRSGPIDRLPLPLRLLQRFSILRRIPARLVGLGVRPEHIRTPDVAAKVRG